MSMEEFRNALSSEARDENEKLKEEIKSSKEKYDKNIKEISEEMKQYKDWCIKLANRCFVHIQGMICTYCTVSICPYAYTKEEMNKVFEYMERNKMPRNEETERKINKMLVNMRYARLKSQKDKVDGN